jgi:hypothetical protein
MVGALVYESFHEGMLECIGGLKRWLSIYVFPLISFGGNYIGVVGDREIEHGYNITYERFSDITEALDKYENLRLCVLVGNYDGAVTSLENYQHPVDNILYVLGLDYGDVEFDKLEAYKDRCDFVHINTKDDFSSMWSHTILGITLWDRFRKNGSN